MLMEDIKKSTKKPRRKLYIPIRIQTNGINKDDIPINTTYISIEDLTNEDSKRKVAGDVEVRYMKNIRMIRNKIKSSNFCSQEQCPVIKERLGQHQLEYHSQINTKPTESRTKGNQTKFKSRDASTSSKQTIHGLTIAEPCSQRSVATSPKTSILKRTIDTQCHENNSIKTLGNKDFNHTVQNNINSNEFKHSASQYDEFTPCHKETKLSFTTNNCLMKDDLEDMVNKCLKDIPINPYDTPSGKTEKRNLINEFIENIFILTNEKITEATYEEKIKIETDNFLNSLPIWYPNGRRDYDLLKKDICKKLLDNLKVLRTKVYVDDAVNTDISLKLFPLDNLENHKIVKLIESEIIDWLMQIKLKESEDIGRTINILDTTYIFTRRLIPLLNTRFSKNNYKLLVKDIILETLNDLPNVLQYPENKAKYINHIAEELTNRLVYILVKCSDSDSCCRFLKSKTMYPMAINRNFNLRSFVNEHNNCINNLQLHFNIIEDVTDILVDCLELVFPEDVIKKHVESGMLSNSIENSEKQSSVTISGNAIENVKYVLTEDIMREDKYSDSVNVPCFYKTVAVYTSEHDLTGPSYPITSTPKRKPDKRENEQHSLKEIEYTNKVSNLIKAWIDTLPKNFNEDKNYKDTIIADLAGDIVDETKLEQLIPNSLDRNQIMSYVIFRWLYKFDVFADLSEDTPPQVGELIKHLNEIAVPDLTRPRYGNRQDLAKLKIKESDRNFFVPKGIDVLEDEISIWMNEQPTEINSINDESKRNKNIHELAATLQKYLFEKRPEKEIIDQISKWLKKILKSSEKDNREKLAESLKERIVRVPQDYTLREKLHKKIEGKLRDEAAKLNLSQDNLANINTSINNPDDTLKKLVIIFMDHNYDVDDAIAREAFGELLKREFRKLSPPTRKEVYDNFTKRKTNEDSSIERFEKELVYIKIISDWLQNIPIESTFNSPHNAERIEFVHNLAKNIYEVEGERRGSPTGMDYNMYLASIISQLADKLPILPEHEHNVGVITDELMKKIIASRTKSCCQNTNRMSSAQRSSGIQAQDISKFIDHYIHQNVEEFAKDSMKLDAWSNRVLKEIKNIAQSTADPSTLCKAQVYSTLMENSISGEHSVNLFAMELDYAREITEWMKNLPLIQNPQADEKRMKLICELAEIMSDRDKNQFATKTAKSDADIEEYINQWIDEIPMDSTKSIVKPILVQQLLKRIEKTKIGNHENSISQDAIKNPSSNTLKSKNKTKINKPRPKSPKCCSTCHNCSKTKNSGQVVVEAIEHWSNNLPIQSDKKDEEEIIKQKIATKLYQKVGALSVDPQIMNDNYLFEKLLSEEIITQLKNIPENASINKKQDVIINELLAKIMDARSIAQENAENYKHQLENTIEASIPNPISYKQSYDPGFEIYKSRLADKFILDNFDHGNDAAKMKYERNIKNEIDQYFQNVQKRNAVPVTKNEIYNELYSALFKVPLPKGDSLIDKVEELKTRCEIDIWFNALPIQEPSNFTELLEKDKLLTMLAKKIHEIETTEKNPEEKLHKEITKWLIKFPLLSNEENNANKFASDLLNILSISKEDRKCVTSSLIKEKKKAQTKTSKALNSESSWVKAAATEPQSCCQIAPTPRKTSAEIILEIVEAWCEQLPLPTTTSFDLENNKIIRDNLLTNIVMKICELNSNPLTFNDEILYDYHLDAELENLLSNLPVCCDFENIKNKKKIQLKAAIKSVMPLMKEEKAGHDYKQKLNTTIDAVLTKPLNITAENIAIFNRLRDDIVDNFIQLHYNEDDDEGKQIYKAKLHEILLKHFRDIKESADEPPVDPLIRQNQLLCELAKVPVPTATVLRDVVEEIKLKDEVQGFFADLGLRDDKSILKNDVELSLAKQLHEIEKKGHSCDNNAKMKNCIYKCLEKLNFKVSSNKVDDFVYKLKANEASRKSLPKKTTITENVKHKLVRIESDIQCRCINSRGITKDSNIRTVPVEYQEFGRNIPASSSIVQENNSQEFNIQGPSFPNTDQFTSDLRYKATQEAPTAEQPVLSPKDPVSVRNRQVTSTNYIDAAICKCGRRFRKLRVKPRRVLRMEDYEYEHCVPPPMWMPYRGPGPFFHF